MAVLYLQNLSTLRGLFEEISLEENNELLWIPQF